MRRLSSPRGVSYRVVLFAILLWQNAFYLGRTPNTNITLGFPSEQAGSRYNTIYSSSSSSSESEVEEEEEEAKIESATVLELSKLKNLLNSYSFLCSLKGTTTSLPTAL